MSSVLGIRGVALVLTFQTVYIRPCLPLSKPQCVLISCKQSTSGPDPNYSTPFPQYTKVMILFGVYEGNLAAAVALKLKKKLRLQVLIYPVLQALDYQTTSYRENSVKLR